MMKLHTIALAAALVAAAGAAQATAFGGAPDLTKVAIVEAGDGSTSATYNGNAVDNLLLISGASASSRTIGVFVLDDNCDKTTLSVAWDSATGSNYRAYACDAKANNLLGVGAGTSLIVVKRDAGGSGQGVVPIASPAKISFMNFTGCTAVAGSPVPSIAQATYTCTGTSPYYPDAGTSDVEPAIIAATANGGSGNLVVTGSLTTLPIFQQLLGVTVNTKLYRALQATQGLTQDDLPANRPSLPSTFVSAAITGRLTGGTAAVESKKGWGLVVSDTVDASVHRKQINICRRNVGSGTQAAAFLRFQELGCTGGALPAFQNTTALAVQGPGTSSNATANTSTALVEACMGNVNALNDATYGAGYAIGHIGRDNDPFAGGGDKGYRFVKLDGAQPEAHPNTVSGLCDNTPGGGDRGFAGCTDAQSGRYNYVYESTLQYNSATPGNAGKLSMITNMASKGFTGTALQGNTAAVVAGVMALPTSYTGNFGNLALTDVGRIFGSRVTRAANSCTPLYISK
jgi:hypothetical protein